VSASVRGGAHGADLGQSTRVCQRWADVRCHHDDVGSRRVLVGVQTVVGLALLLVVPAFLAWGVYVDVTGDEQPVEPRQYIQPVGQSSFVGGCAGGRLGICG
jgi:hypothetical protein